MEEIKLIKETILDVAKEYNVDIDKIILFGSRARGDYREDSDWDILIVTKQALDRKTKFGFWYDIYRKLKFPADIIIVSKDVFERYKSDYGFIYAYALEEGIVL